MWREGSWEEDDATRFFLLAASRHDLLSLPEQRFIKFFFLHQKHINESANLNSFKEFWNSPSIDTTHLTEGRE